MNLLQTMVESWGRQHPEDKPNFRKCKLYRIARRIAHHRNLYFLGGEIVLGMPTEPSDKKASLIVWQGREACWIYLERIDYVELDHDGEPLQPVADSPFPPH